MQTLAHLKYPTHRVHITVNDHTGLIHCFKYNSKKCDHRIFAQEDQTLCADYILEALPQWEWGFVEDSDQL